MKVIAILALVVGLGASLLGCGGSYPFSGGNASSCLESCQVCTSDYDCCHNYGCALYTDGLYRCAWSGPLACKPG